MSKKNKKTRTQKTFYTSLKKWFFPEKIASGIEVNEKNVVIATAEEKEKTSTVSLKICPLTETCVLDDQTIIASVLQSEETTLRPLTLALTKIPDIDKAYVFQMDDKIPFNAKDAIFERIIVKKTATETSLLVAACKKEALKKHLEYLEKKGFDPEVVLEKSLALLSFCTTFFSEIPNKIVIDISDSEATCVLIQDKEITGSRSIPVPSSFHSEENKEDAIFYSFFREIARVLLYFEQFENAETPLLFTGQQTSNPLFIELLEDFLKKPTLSAPNLTLKKTAPTITWSDCVQYAVPIGAALFCITPKTAAFTFRKGEFSYTKQWSRWKKPLSGYFVLSILIACALFFLGNRLLETEQKVLIDKYSTLLKALHSSKEDVEKELKSSTPFNQLSRDDIEQRIFFLEEKQKKTPEPFALHPDIPRVQDTLNWLVTITDALTPEEKKELKLQDVSYTMVKRPQIKSKSDKYQARIQLRFSTENATAARKLHDLIFSENTFVDLKAEKTWKMQKEQYTISFFLKDKTRYLQ